MPLESLEFDLLVVRTDVFEQDIARMLFDHLLFRCEEVVIMLLGVQDNVHFLDLIAQSVQIPGANLIAPR